MKQIPVALIASHFVVWTKKLSYIIKVGISMNRKVISLNEENIAQKIGEYILSQFDVDGILHRRSGIILPGYNVDGKLVTIDIQIADAAEDEQAYPLFLDAETASSM